MPSCELCGRSTELLIADVEGVELKVCPGCAKFGRVRRPVPLPAPKIKPEAPEFAVVENYASLLRSAREQRGLTQEDFAKLLQEKQSAVAHWEAGTARPEIDAARRIGKILSVTLIKQEETAPSMPEQKKKSEELTLGDFVKVRKRR